MKKPQCKDCDNLRTYDKGAHCMYVSWHRAEWIPTSEVFKEGCKHFNINAMDEMRQDGAGNLEIQKLTDFLENKLIGDNK